jgi:hypothetical protein
LPVGARILIVILSAGLLGACTKSVAYYAAHPKERAARIADCLGPDLRSQECRNANQAEFDAPPVNGQAASPPSNSN